MVEVCSIGAMSR